MQRLEKKQEKPSPILFRAYFLLISWGILGTAVEIRTPNIIREGNVGGQKLGAKNYLLYIILQSTE